MPNVVDAYKKLHKKGFEIIGISLDEDKSAMEAALKKEPTIADDFEQLFRATLAAIR